MVSDVEGSLRALPPRLRGLGPHHTPPVEADGVDLDELRQLFPGF